MRVVCRWDFNTTLVAELLDNLQECMDWLEVREMTASGFAAVDWPYSTCRRINCIPTANLTAVTVAFATGAPHLHRGSAQAD